MLLCAQVCIAVRACCPYYGQRGRKGLMASHAAFEQPELLTSWKEIASYLGKGVRTVQRWEQQFGLPVRRPNERVKGIVHATRHELDRWLEIEWSQRPGSSGLSHSISERLEAVRANIKYSAELRRANRLLLEDIRASVSVIQKECQSISLTLADTSKPN